jgi:hypothetical protein
MHYRFYILDQLGAFVDVADALCPNDDAACLAAQRQLGSAPAIQVWQQARFIGQIERRQAA